jgi:hypothetical protein
MSTKKANTANPYIGGPAFASPSVGGEPGPGGAAPGDGHSGWSPARLWTGNPQNLALVILAVKKAPIKAFVQN